MNSSPKSARAWFVTGTDTEIGKTFSTCALLHAARARGLDALAMKPVAAGTVESGGETINEDVAALRAACSHDPGIGLLNPWCLAAPVAPHIAAAEAGVTIAPAPIEAALAELRRRADVVFVEGVGGFRVPLADAYDSADLARDLGLPVVLVVGLRLGCINHALLSCEAIERRGLRLAGWIGNRIDPDMLRPTQNVDSLRARIAAPLLGVLEWRPDSDARAAAAALTLPD